MEQKRSYNSLPHQIFYRQRLKRHIYWQTPLDTSSCFYSVLLLCSWHLPSAEEKHLEHRITFRRDVSEADPSISIKKNNNRGTCCWYCSAFVLPNAGSLIISSSVGSGGMDWTLWCQQSCYVPTFKDILERKNVFLKAILKDKKTSCLTLCDHNNHNNYFGGLCSAGNTKTRTE